MKKILILGLTSFSLTFTVPAQTITHIWRAMPLLSGYNVSVPSNQVVGPAVLPGSGVAANVVATNVLWTKYNGQIVYSYSNNVNGGMGTNGYIADAFQSASLVSDANGDINANACLWIALNQTNYLPVIATNSFGQIVVPGTSTNGLLPVFGGPNPTLWPLAVNSGPNWLPQGTTNFYPLYSQSTGVGVITNNLIVSLYRAPGFSMQGGIGPDLQPKVNLFENAPVWVWYINVTNGLPQVLSSNLPATLLQGGKDFVVTLGLTNSIEPVTTNTASVLVNQVLLLQPQ